MFKVGQKWKVGFTWSDVQTNEICPCESWYTPNSLKVCNSNMAKGRSWIYLTFTRGWTPESYLSITFLNPLIPSLPAHNPLLSGYFGRFDKFRTIIKEKGMYLFKQSSQIFVEQFVLVRRERVKMYFEPRRCSSSRNTLRGIHHPSPSPTFCSEAP